MPEQEVVEVSPIRSQGNLYGGGSTRTTDYNKLNSQQILSDLDQLKPR
ncbi:MAG: hypothetical protein HYT11_04070 [Candidatus Levybacteria bacterium]|nr:hypothetical protein [Candidatus Levybacteria bacterium]